MPRALSVALDGRRYIIYLLFLQSDQGEVLSREILEKPLAGVTIAAVILLTGAVLFVSCLLALIASIPRYSGLRTRFRIAVAGIWVVAICTSFGIIFARTTGSLTAWGASVGLAILMLVPFNWAIKDRKTNLTTGYKFLYQVNSAEVACITASVCAP